MVEKPLIPLDVIETIVDILATIDDGDYSSIKACSLSCRSFLRFCRKHIFARVVLDSLPRFVPTPLPSSQFQRLLKTTPEIVDYVRDFTFGFPTSYKDGDDKIYLELSEMLKKFTRVQRLTITSRWNGQLYWTNVPYYLQDAVFYLLNLPTINYLALSSISNFPILQLTRCINLHHLHISSFLAPVIDHLSSTSHSRSIVLDEYSMGMQSFEVLNVILKMEGPNGQPVFDFRNIKKYSAFLHKKEYITKIGKILKRINQLVSIDLEVGNDIFDLSGLARTMSCSLKSLKRIVVRYTGPCDQYSALRPRLVGLPKQLKLIAEMPNALEALEIQVNLSSYLIKDESQWGQLDDALNVSGLSSLKAVSIHILTRSCSPYMVSMEQLPFPNLSSRKDIVFDLTIDDVKVPSTANK